MEGESIVGAKAHVEMLPDVVPISTSAGMIAFEDHDGNVLNFQR